MQPTYLPHVGIYAYADRDHDHGCSTQLNQPYTSSSRSRVHTHRAGCGAFLISRGKDGRLGRIRTGLQDSDSVLLGIVDDLTRCLCVSNLLVYLPTYLPIYLSIYLPNTPGAEAWMESPSVLLPI